MSQVKADSSTLRDGAWVPPLQRTAGQPEPIAANGGASYAALERDGDAGTAAATEDAIRRALSGRGQTVIDSIESAPPGPIDTKWGLGFRRYRECLDYIREQGIEAPEGGIAAPLRYTVDEDPTYSIVPSNALWQDPESEARLGSPGDLT